MINDLMLMAYVDNELNQEGRRLIEIRTAQDPVLKARLLRLQQTAQLTKLSTVSFGVGATDPRIVGLMHGQNPARGRRNFVHSQVLRSTTLLLLGVVLGMLLVTVFMSMSHARPIDSELNRPMGWSRQ